MISAVARPMPRPAAVISATLPVKRMTLVLVGRIATVEAAQQPRPHELALAAAARLLRLAAA